MMTESSPPTISEKARTCLISFEKCLAQMTTLDYLSQSLIENEFARFSVWTSNIGVFANGRASMDHRLREAPDVQKLVLGLLDVLFRRIDKYLSSLRNTNDSLLSDPDGQAATADAFLKSEVEYIASEISLLHELSNTIRKASRKTTDVKAAALFHIQDDEGNDLEEPLKNYFATNIRDQFPGISDVLRLRLAKAMVVRRKRILYKRSRFAPMRIAQPSNQPVIQAPITKETDPGSVILEDVKESKPLAPLQPLFSSVAKSITKSATTLAPQNYQKATAPSVISQSKTIALGSHQDLVFPSVPKHDPTTIEITCPFCMLILPIKDIKDEKSWREHLKNDLDPYVCLTEDCDCPDELFRHSGEWLRHMRKHSLHWRCASKSHGSMFFSTRDDYISHMNEKHGKAINDEQIAVLADRSLQLNGPLFKSCPLCGIEAQDYTGPLEDHIVGHLRSLALKSLPPIHNEDEVEDGLGENDKTDRERSTVKNDPDHHMPLDFELDSSNPYDLVGDVSSEEADDYWDFMPINTKANLHEDAIIQHLTEQFPNVFDLPESAEEEVNQGVDADADEDTDASKPEAEQDAQPDSGAKADPEFDMSPAKIEALFTPKERGSRKSKPKDEPEAETELEPESKSNVNQWQNSSERLRSLSGRIANNLKPFKQTPEEVADPVYPLSLPPPASNLDEEEEEAAEEDQDQTWPPPLTDIRPIGRGEMRDNYLQRIWRQPHEQPASPIPHFDLSGEQEGSKVEGQSTAFEKFIDEIEDRWQSEKEAWAQKGFESEGFFAFLDHHFDSPGVVLPDSQLQLKLSTLEKYQTALRVHEWHNKKRLTQDFANTPPAAQQKSIATYSHNFQQYFGNQMGSKQMVGGVPQNQSSPMMAPGGPDGNALNAFYGPTMDGPNAMRGGGGQAQPTGSNHALQDYQMQLMLLEQQNKKRLMMARQEQSDMGGIPRDNQPGAAGPNGQPFPDTSPQAMRSGTSPNPAEQMKRGTPQMNNSGISSPVPDGAQSRESPNPAMNFLGNHVNVSMAPHFYKGGADESMAAAQAQMNGMRPPSSHPGQPFNGPMNAQQQQMMAARQGVPGNPQQWQQGMNGQMVPGGMPQQGQPVQGTPQQRSMPPPSAPAAANANNRTTASPQQAAAAPPTPSQSNKAAPKKKESKSAKDKRLAAQKKSNQNNNAAASAAENGAEAEVNAPATPITPVVAPGSFKANQAGNPTPNAPAPTVTTGVPTPAAAASAPVPQPAAPLQQPAHDLVGPTSLGAMESNFGMDFGTMDMNPLGSTDVLNDFDFDSFLNDGENGNEDFVFPGGYSGMEGGEIGAE